MHGRAPASLTRRLSFTQRIEVTRWWHGLTSAERRALRPDGGRPRPGVMARFVEAGQSEDNVDGPTDFYEYLVNHELSFEDGRRYHICSAHPAARTVIKAGHVPADFRCPRGNTPCPMRALLDAAPGCDVRLSLTRLIQVDDADRRGGS